LVGPDDTYDVKKYQEMLVKATEEILIHFGYDKKRLEEEVKKFEGSRIRTVGDYPRFTLACRQAGTRSRKNN
jgi:hypothetical protein